MGPRNLRELRVYCKLIEGEVIIILNVDLPTWSQNSTYPYTCHKVSWLIYGYDITAL